MNEDMAVNNYTPCRIIEAYNDDGSEITLGFGRYDIFHLRGPSRLLWLMLDGKHTIDTIVNRLCSELSVLCLH